MTGLADSSATDKEKVLILVLWYYFDPNEVKKKEPLKSDQKPFIIDELKSLNFGWRGRQKQGMGLVGWNVATDFSTTQCQ